jgi:type IV pilus assembly protein PilP
VRPRTLQGRTPQAQPEIVKKSVEQAPQATVPDKEQVKPTDEVVQSQPEKKEEPAKSVSRGVGDSDATVSPASTMPSQKTKTADTPEAGATAPEARETKAAEVPETEATAEARSLKDSFLDDTVPKYDPTGKTDPFIALFSKERATDVSEDTAPKRPLTPLEKIDLSQLQLVAVLQAASGDRAMVEDAAGKGYVLRLGTFVGLNSGVVTKIQKDRVVIEEKSRDFLGRESSGTKELKLQKPFGE